MSNRTSYYLSLFRRKVVIGAVLGGVILGFVVIGLVRFAGMNGDETHYHANFAVFINGQKQDFKGPQYYQEVSACNEHASPLGRVHMHDENPGLVHVHDKVVTWGDLFTNIGWSLSNTMVFDGSNAYINDQGGKLSFVLNGKQTRSVADEVIGDQDRLLISYGAGDDGTLQKEFAQVGSDAKKADTTADPSTCQGPEHVDAWTKLRKAFFF